ncbi:MAG TPA: hypothetical protein VHS78_08675 [Candidatus Elarobacter sp.]|jgi:O-antigen/teichoic acid export membrane protein|nr:hypothetical protein [Candidatus Elarobacter sp.]
MMHLFLKITGIVVVALVVLALLGWLLHLIITAAIIAALIVGGIAIANLFRRRRGTVVTYEPGRYGTRRYR